MLYFLLIACSTVLWLANTADAATYWVAKTGSDSRSCAQAQSQSTPKQTIAAGFGCLSPGDTLMVKAGTYNEGNFTIPGGSSDATRITVKAETTGTVTIVPPVSDQPGVQFQNYATLEGVIIDASNVSLGVYFNATHVRIKDTEIKNASGAGMRPLGSNCELLNLTIHHTAWGLPCFGSGEPTPFDGYCHGVYMAGNDNLIDGGNFYNNNGYGIQIYPSGDRNVVRNARWHDNYGVGIGVFHGNDNQIYNNVTYANGGFGLWGAAHTTLIYNNTVYGNTGAGLYLNTYNGQTARNNILYNNAGGNIVNEVSSTIDTNLTSNPSFVNAGGGDFHLSAGSAAIDAGATISLVTTDFDKRPRPQGAGFDIGACEYSGSPPSPLSAPTNFRIVGE